VSQQVAVSEGPKSLANIRFRFRQRFAKSETERCLENLNIGRELRKGEEAKTIYTGVIKLIGAKIARPNANNREASQKGGGVCERHPSI